MACHNTPSITSQTITSSTRVNTTLSGVQSIAVPYWSTGLMSVSRRLYAMSVQHLVQSFSNWRSCRITCISSWKSIPSTGFIAWYAPSKAVLHGSCAKNIPGSSPGCQRSGRTRTLSPPWAGRLGKSSCNTSSSRNGCKMIQRQRKLRRNPLQEANSTPGCSSCTSPVPGRGIICS